MSQLTSVVKEIARPVGNVAPVMPIIVAYQSGCSATARTTVAIVPMNFPRVVQSATAKRNSNAPTTDACQNNGSAISRTIAVTAVTKPTLFARASIEHARNRSIVAQTANAYRPDGDATTRTIVEITVTRLDVRISFARYPTHVDFYSIIERLDRKTRRVRENGQKYCPAIDFWSLK